VLVTVLLTWQIVSSVAAHPDYLAYFNELAPTDPAEAVVESDLDWGQDLKRLANTLSRLGVGEVSIRYHGSHGIELDRFNFPVVQRLEPYQKPTGWIAISAHHLKLGTASPPFDQFTWLSELKPAVKVGKSIRLYHIEENIPVDAEPPR
jgi:hypothetical protein